MTVVGASHFANVCGCPALQFGMILVFPQGFAACEEFHEPKAAHFPVGKFSEERTPFARAHESINILGRLFRKENVRAEMSFHGPQS